MSPFPRKTQDALDRLRALSPEDPDRRAVIEAGLRHRSGAVIQRAAALVLGQDHRGMEAALEAALARLSPGGVKKDPGCGARLAILEALDQQDHLDPTPFEDNIAYRQPEPSWGPPVDTAVGVRVRCALALARLSAPGHLALLADRLADPEPAVRREIPRAIAHSGNLGGPALLRLKIQLGDREGEVVGAALAALAVYDAPSALTLADAVLAGPLPGEQARCSDPSELFDAVLLGLAESRIPGALDLFIDHYERSVHLPARRVALTAIAVLRNEAARDYLLGQVRTADRDGAVAALQALSMYRFDPQVGELVQRAADGNAALGREAGAVQRYFLGE